MTKLKPCPICGNNNIEVVVDDAEYSLGLIDEANFKVVCGTTSCGCGLCTEWHPTEQNAVAEWNNDLKRREKCSNVNTSSDIKLRIAGLMWAGCHDDCTHGSDSCPVAVECSRSNTLLCDQHTAAKLIEFLATELEQVKRERDVAVEELKEYLTCHGCVNDDFCKKDYPVCDGCALEKCPCYSCTGLSNWQWRGTNRRE